MKKLITSIMTCLLAGVLITSCGTRKSFTKSNYNNRYYIGMSKRANTEKLPAEATEKTIEESVTATNETKQNSNSEELESTLVNPEVIAVNEAVNKPVVEPVIDETEEGTIAENATDLNETQRADKRGFNDANTTVKKNDEIQNRFKLNEFIPDLKQNTIGEKISHSSSDGDTLSLLWIIIIVILILWAFGYAYAASSLIHLLLVIALILLILWLLRII